MGKLTLPDGITEILEYLARPAVPESLGSRIGMR